MDAQIGSGAPAQAAPRARSLRRSAFQIGAALSLSILVAVILIRFGDTISRLGDWGYLGIFVIQVMNSATILLPAPGHAYTFAIAASLSPLLVGLIGGFGSGLGELTGYALGVGGRDILAGGRLYGRMLALAKRRGGGITLFLFAALPLPFDVAGIWAGTTRYPIWRFLLYVIMGKIVKVTGIAFVGFYSVPWLIRLLA